MKLTRQAWFVVSSIGLAVLCLAIDWFLASWNPNIVFLRRITQLITGSVVHALIGGWCWFNVWLLQLDEEWSGIKQNQIVICAVMASLLDVDYIIEAKFSVETEMKETKQTFLHNTSLILLIAVILYVLVYIIPRLRSTSFSKDFPTMFLVSSLSHLLRDADKTGMWFAPFGSTPPLPFKLYVFLVVLLPLVIANYKMIPQVIKGQVDWREAIRFRQTPKDISSA